MEIRELVTLADIKAAKEVIGKRVHRTPMATSTSIGKLLGIELHLKLELFQKTGSFKPRGVLNKLYHLSPQEKGRGVISLSAGNHAQALAWGASQENISSTIVMPAKSSPGKVRATQAYGGKVILTEGNLLDECISIKEKENLTLVHPFDDLHVIAGQGTVGLEILEDITEIEKIIVSIGGGGLISGVAAAIKHVRPEIKIIGVEPSGADAMSRSLNIGHPVTLSSVNTIADGLAAPFAGRHTYNHVKEYVDEVVIVNDDELNESLILMMERTKVIPEPAASATLAALQFGKIEITEGEKILCVICGGNIDRMTLKSIL